MFRAHKIRYLLGDIAWTTVLYVCRPRVSLLSNSMSGHNSNHNENSYHYVVLTMHQGKIACFKTSRERDRAEFKYN